MSCLLSSLMFSFHFSSRYLFLLVRKNNRMKTSKRCVLMKEHSDSFVVLSYFSPSGRYREHLYWLLIFRLELTVVFQVSANKPEHSLEFVIFMDLFQHFGVRWLTIHFSVHLYFLNNTYGSLIEKWYHSYRGERKKYVIVYNCVYTVWRFVATEPALKFF